MDSQNIVYLGIWFAILLACAFIGDRDYWLWRIENWREDRKLDRMIRRQEGRHHAEN